VLVLVLRSLMTSFGKCRLGMVWLGVIGLLLWLPLYSKPSDQGRRYAWFSADECYQYMIQSYHERDWGRTTFAGLDLIQLFPSHPFAREGCYYLGVAYFHLGDYRLSNFYFSKYLSNAEVTKFFHEVMKYKLLIGGQFAERASPSLFGRGKLQKALDVYEEIIVALPSDDLSAQALYRKGKLLVKSSRYQEGIDAYQTLICRFPEHTLSPQGYEGISEAYLLQCETRYPDYDYLDLAEINLKNIYERFPHSPCVAQVKRILHRMKEHFAEHLLGIGVFYQGRCQLKAAGFCYMAIVRSFPETLTSQLAKKKLLALDPKIFDGEDIKRKEELLSRSP